MYVRKGGGERERDNKSGIGLAKLKEEWNIEELTRQQTHLVGLPQPNTLHNSGFIE